MVNDLEIENSDFNIIDEEILNMKVFDWLDRYYFNIGDDPNKNWMQITVCVKWLVKSIKKKLKNFKKICLLFKNFVL